MQERKIDYLKKQLDIVEVAQTYGELKKSGSNYVYKDDKSIVINPAKQIFSDFNGSITGGSVLDLIMYMEKIDLKSAINKLKELAGADTYKLNPAKQLQRQKEADKKKDVDFQKLGYIGKLHLKSIRDFNFIPLLHEQKDKSIKEFIVVPDDYKKLFESSLLPKNFLEKIEYLKNNLLGYDNFFKCPSIIIRNIDRKIVDIISYRPQKPDNFEEWNEPKYIYKNSHHRGENFLFPFQIEFEAILKKEDFFIVGEGIKNALNALLYSVPYITIESTSNKINKDLLNYIIEKTKTKKIICMFDGDEAGQKAFLNFKEQSSIQNLQNFFDFNSKLDFVDYIKSE